MKNSEELKAIKDEYKKLTEKLSELSEDELKQVTGGGTDTPPCGNVTCRYSCKEVCTYYKAVQGNTKCKFN